MFEVGQVLTMKKPHPCGGMVWTVARVGVDVKIQCNTCKRFVNLTSDDLKKRVKKISITEQEDK